MLDILLRVQMFGFAGFVLDKVDNSVTRSDPYFRELFKRCGLYILSVKVNVQTCQCYLVTWHSLSNHSFIWSLQMKQDQNELPKELFAVKMYALVTSQPKMQNSGKRRRPKNKPRMIRSWKMPVLGVLMDQLICTVMYYYLFVSVSRTSVLQSQFCFIYIFFCISSNFPWDHLNWCCITCLLLKYMMSVQRMFTLFREEHDEVLNLTGMWFNILMKF
jgi:hypothetical protein